VAEFWKTYNGRSKLETSVRWFSFGGSIEQFVVQKVIQVWYAGGGEKTVKRKCFFRFTGYWKSADAGKPGRSRA